MISTGICSWAEKTLLESGEFYPAGAETAERRLRYYASVFGTVEVDSTYYAVPLEKTTMLWSERTPEDFVFHVKAYAALTGHAVLPGGLPRSLRRHAAGKEGQAGRVYVKDRSALEDIAGSFKNAVAPLGGKLGIIVFQFPQWLRFGEK